MENARQQSASIYRTLLIRAAPQRVAGRATEPTFSTKPCSGFAMRVRSHTLHRERAAPRPPFFDHTIRRHHLAKGATTAGRYEPRNSYSVHCPATTVTVPFQVAEAALPLTVCVPAAADIVIVPDWPQIGDPLGK